MKPRTRFQELQKDKRLSRMVIVSAVLHVIVIVAIVASVTRSQSGQNRPVAYTVELVNPAALGTNIPSGGGKTTAVSEPSAAKKPAEPQPQPKPAVTKPTIVKKEEPKVVPPPPPPPQEAVKLPVKAKPVEKPPTKPEPQKAKPEEKKPEVKTAATKPEPEKNRGKPQEKQGESKKSDTLSPEELDRLHAAAVERIKAQMKEQARDPGRDGLGGPTGGGSGPLTIGGAPGEGGGGLVRGLEFIMYTEQVKRRVRDSWIVAEKKAGLKATVRFGIRPDGEIFAVELLKPSGDRAFDESVVRAVRQANPLPPPPQAYQQEFAMQKVEVTFGGEERVN